MKATCRPWVAPHWVTFLSMPTYFELIHVE